MAHLEHQGKFVISDLISSEPLSSFSVGDIEVKFLGEWRSITLFKGIYLSKKKKKLRKLLPKIIYPNTVIHMLFCY